ncbi:unnamed protein product [Laminaria digitata]
MPKKITASQPQASGDVSVPSVGGGGVDVDVAVPLVDVDASAPYASIESPGVGKGDLGAAVDMPSGSVDIPSVDVSGKAPDMPSVGVEVSGDLPSFGAKLTGLDVGVEGGGVSFEEGLALGVTAAVGGATAVGLGLSGKADEPEGESQAASSSAASASGPSAPAKVGGSAPTLAQPTPSTSGDAKKSASGWKGTKGKKVPKKEVSKELEDQRARREKKRGDKAEAKAKRGRTPFGSGAKEEDSPGEPPPSGEAGEEAEKSAGVTPSKGDDAPPPDKPSMGSSLTGRGVSGAAVATADVRSSGGAGGKVACGKNQREVSGTLDATTLQVGVVNDKDVMCGLISALQLTRHWPPLERKAIAVDAAWEEPEEAPRMDALDPLNKLSRKGNFRA